MSLLETGPRVFMNACFLQPRRQATDKDNVAVKHAHGFIKTYNCVEEIEEKVVDNWSTRQYDLSLMSPDRRRCINSLKSFMHANKTLAVFHPSSEAEDD